MCRAPVMFGGGRAMANAFRLLAGSARPIPRASQRSRQRGSTVAGAKVLSIPPEYTGRPIAVPKTQLLRARTQHAELVALWVSHHHPRYVPLTDVDRPGTERGEPGDLGRLIVRAKVEMNTVLDGLRFG